MSNLNILIVEGNIREDSEFFIKAAGASAADNLKNLILKLEPSTNTDIINPGHDDETTNALNNIHHGLSNAIFMPYVLTYNKDMIKDKIIKVCEYLEIEEKSFNGFLNWILDLRKKLEIPHKLSDVIDENNFELDRLSKMAFNDPSTGGNPIKLTEKDMKILYQHSMSGELF